MINMSTDYDESKELHKKAGMLKARWPMYGEMIDWMVDLLVETICARQDIVISELAFDPDIMEKDLIKGKPVFDSSTAPVDYSRTWKTYFSLVEKTERTLGIKSGGLKKILSDSESKRCQFIKETFKEDYETLEETCQTHGVDPHVVRLLLRIALRPSLVEIAAKVATAIDHANWSYGYCPVCGSFPGIAKLDGNQGSRTLFCSLCETSWAYPRLRCPFCKNDNQAELTYLYAEDEAGVRMDMCSRCQGRIKTIDARYPSGVVVPVLDDLVTSHLNMAIVTA